MACRSVYLCLLLMNLQTTLAKTKIRFSVTKDNSNFRRLYNLSVNDCRKECAARPACESINYFRLSRSCDLNKMATGSRGTEGGMRRSAGYVHSKKSEWTDSMFVSCDCPPGQKCDSTNGYCVVAECEMPAYYTRANMLALGSKSDDGVLCMRDLPTVHSFGAGLEPATFPYTVNTCSSDGNWIITTPPRGPCHATVFTIVPGTKKDPYEEWKDGISSLYEPNRTKPYRSHVIDKWVHLPISHVRLSIYKKHNEVKYVLFNGTGSTNIDWFSASRVMDSSWQDLAMYSWFYPGNGRYFSLAGNKSLLRRFFITKRNFGCPVDSGWFTVTVGETCSWEMLHETRPVIIYSKLNEAGNYNDNSEIADYVYVTLCLGSC